MEVEVGLDWSCIGLGVVDHRDQKRAVVNTKIRKCVCYDEWVGNQDVSYLLSGFKAGFMDVGSFPKAFLMMLKGKTVRSRCHHPRSNCRCQVQHLLVMTRAFLSSF